MHTSTYEVGYYYGGTPHSRVVEIFPTVPESGVVAEEVVDTFTDIYEVALDQASLRLGVELHTLIDDEVTVTRSEAIAARQGRRDLDILIDRVYTSREDWAVGYGLALTFETDLGDAEKETVYLYVIRKA